MAFWNNGICLLPIVLRIENKIPSSDMIKMVGLGILGIGLVGLSYTAGIAHSTAINGTILINAHPFFRMLLAPRSINEESSNTTSASYDSWLYWNNYSCH